MTSKNVNQLDSWGKKIRFHALTPFGDGFPSGLATQFRKAELVLVIR